MSKPLPPASPIVGIVGSAGAYGRWLASFLQWRMGLHVLGSDPGDAHSLDPDSLIARSDVLVFALPVQHTTRVISDYAERAGARASSQLWLDLTSVKAGPVAAMLGSMAEVVGLHPMTAPPKTPTLRGRPLVVCEARLQQWRPWLQQLLAALEAQCVYTSPADHDRRMALVQTMVHAGHLAQTAAMARWQTHTGQPDDLLPYRSVGFSMDLATSARILSGNAELYIDILFGNPHALESIDSLLVELQRIRDDVVQRNRDGLREHTFADNRAWFGAGALAQGNYLFERIGYLLADLADPLALHVHLPLDKPGSLRQLLEVFEDCAINLDSLHSSRTPAGEVHFRLGFAQGTPPAALQRASALVGERGIGHVLPALH